jgi:hypothetical protein
MRLLEAALIAGGERSAFRGWRKYDRNALYSKRA